MSDGSRWVSDEAVQAAVEGFCDAGDPSTYVSITEALAAAAPLIARAALQAADERMFFTTDGEVTGAYSLPVAELRRLLWAVLDD